MRCFLKKKVTSCNINKFFPFSYTISHQLVIKHHLSSEHACCCSALHYNSMIVIIRSKTICAVTIQELWNGTGEERNVVPLEIEPRASDLSLQCSATEPRHPPTEVDSRRHHLSFFLFTISKVFGLWWHGLSLIWWSGLWIVGEFHQPDSHAMISHTIFHDQ